MIAIPALLREAGVDPDELLAEFGLPSSLFEDPDNVIRFTTMGWFLAARAKHPVRHTSACFSESSGVRRYWVRWAISSKAPPTHALRRRTRAGHVPPRP